MSIEDQEIIKQEAYAEALRYMRKAEKNLQKTGKEDDHYQSRRNVRTACGTAYSGTLIALDAWLKLHNIPAPAPDAKYKTIAYYRQVVERIDYRLFLDVDSAYNTLYLLGNCYGNLLMPIIQDGFDIAFDIIDRIKPAHPIAPEAWAERRRKRSVFGKLYSMLFV
jgi:hypothetical protein